MGLLDTFIKLAVGSIGHANEEGGGEGGFVIWNKNWEKVMKVTSKIPPGCPVAGLRVARKDLRCTLVEAVEKLPRTEIRWDTVVSSISAVDEGAAQGSKVELQLSDGKKEVHDLLIAADGSSSRLRTLLRPSDPLTFPGPTCIYGTTSIAHHPSGNPSEFGSMISGEGVAIFIAPTDAETLVWNLSWIHPGEPPVHKRGPLTGQDNEDAKAEALQKGQPFGKRWEKMLESTEEGKVTRFNAMDKQAFAHSSTPPYITSSDPTVTPLNTTKQVVFLGDANHAVSPFAGNGANLALMDGWDFAESLIESKSLLEAVQKFDKLAVDRANAVIKRSHFTMRVMHSTGLWWWIYISMLTVVRWLFFR